MAQHGKAVEIHTHTLLLQKGFDSSLKLESSQLKYVQKVYIINSPTKDTTKL